MYLLRDVHTVHFLLYCTLLTVPVMYILYSSYCSIGTCFNYCLTTHMYSILRLKWTFVRDSSHHAYSNMNIYHPNDIFQYLHPYIVLAPYKSPLSTFIKKWNKAIIYIYKYIGPVLVALLVNFFLHSNIWIGTTRWVPHILKWTSKEALVFKP